MKTFDAKKVRRSIAADIEVKPYTGKRAFDIVGALVMCAAFAPIAMCVGALVWRQSGRPILFRHRRVGQAGQAFYVYKFRSMVKEADVVLDQLLLSNADAAIEWQESRKLKNDPRITSIGRLLRKTSLDELPQVLNVLKGDMSLVGPRPVVVEELERYGKYLPYYLAVKPGLTGLWQVSGRNDVSYDERVALDVRYVGIQSVFTDIGITLKTAKVLFSPTGN